MQATFRLAADLVIEVDNGAYVGDPCAYLRIVTGVDRKKQTRHVEREIAFKKTEARAVASALMGCAAEL